MVFLYDDIEIIDGYEVLGQNVIDQAVVKNSQISVPSGGEQLSVQSTVGPAATGYSIGVGSSALVTARSPEEFDAQVEMFKVELNAKQLTLSKFENRTPLSGSDLFNRNISGNFSINPDLTKIFMDKVQYNFEINIGPTNIAIVPSELDAWEADNGFYLLPDDFGIPRKFKNGIMVSEDQFKVEILHNAYNDAINITLGSTLVPTASASVDSRFSTDSSDLKNRIGDYYQVAGIFYKVTANGPQQVSLSEVIHQRVWAITEDGTAGWWTVDEQGKLNFAGLTGTIRVVGNGLWQIGPNGKDNYLGKAPTADSADPKKRIGNYYQEEGKYYKVTELGPQQVSLSEVIYQRVWAADNKGRAGWWTVREDGLIEWAGETGDICVVGDGLWQIASDGKDNYKGARVQELVKKNGQWTLVFSSEGNDGEVTLYDENKKVIFSCDATSGRIGETNRSKEYEGPIRFGSYTLDPKEISGGLGKAIQRNLILGRDWGLYRVPLKPQEGTNMGTRGEFFLHGGFFAGSAGCIDIGTNDRVLFPLLMQHKSLINVEVIQRKEYDILFPNGGQNFNT